MRKRRSPTALLVVLCWGAGAQAAPSAKLHGIVRDPVGAVWPGAEIHLVDIGSGELYTATANSKGEYAFENVPVGLYSIGVDVECFGYKRDRLKLRRGE